MFHNVWVGGEGLVYFSDLTQNAKLTKNSILWVIFYVFHVFHVFFFVAIAVLCIFVWYSMIFESIWWFLGSNNDISCWFSAIFSYFSYVFLFLAIFCLAHRYFSIFNRVSLPKDGKVVQSITLIFIDFSSFSWGHRASSSWAPAAPPRCWLRKKLT